MLRSEAEMALYQCRQTTGTTTQWLRLGFVLLGMHANVWEDVRFGASPRREEKVFAKFR